MAKLGKRSTQSQPAPLEPLEKLPPIYVKMIYSGGQTGVDRAALEMAIELDIPHGGWCPRGRLAEDGPIAKKFKLKETESDRYYVRTERNVKEAEGTLILYRRALSGGTALTRSYAQRHRKPHLCIPLKAVSTLKQIARIRTWLHEHKISILNIAGPRESSAPGIASEAKQLLRQLLHTPRHALPPVANAKSKPVRRSPAK